MDPDRRLVQRSVRSARPPRGAPGSRPHAGGSVGILGPYPIPEMRIGILTGGGDAPGLNAAIRAVARRAFSLGHQVSGVQNGWAGCLEDGLIREMTALDVRGILPMGGTILGTSRTNPLKEKDGVASAMRRLHHNGVDALVGIGGDDTLSVAAAMHEAGFPTVGGPQT